MLSRIFGWYWNTAAWPLKLAIGVPILVIFIVLVVSLKSCLTPKPNLHVDEDDLRGVNSRNAAERDKALTTVLEKNKDVVQTVEKDSTLADTNVVERNRKIDEAVREADRKVQEAKRSLGRDVTSEELERLIMEQ